MYEADEEARCLIGGKLGSESMSSKENTAIMKTMDAVRRLWKAGYFRLPREFESEGYVEDDENAIRSRPKLPARSPEMPARSPVWLFLFRMSVQQLCRGNIHVQMLVILYITYPLDHTALKTGLTYRSYSLCHGSSFWKNHQA